MNIGDPPGPTCIFSELLLLLLLLSHSVISDSSRFNSPPGSSVRGIVQAGILEWAIKLTVIKTFNEKIAFMRGHMQKIKFIVL